MDHTPRLGLPYLLANQAQKHVTLNESLSRLDALAQIGVLSRELEAPPEDPAEGEGWIVPADASGAWAGEEGGIAVWQDGAWAVYPPQPGWLAYVLDEAALVVWSGAAWLAAVSPPAQLQNLTRLGLGTEADAENPFAAKLNKALWTARYDGEGGDGDLRYTLNKEAPGNTLSLLMQTGWSGRAEIGLTGDDDLTVKVSPDGETWTEGLKIISATGTARLRNTVLAVDSGLALDIDVDEGGDGVFRATRYAESANAPVFFGRKARGTRAAPAAVQAGDTLIGFRGYGHTGTDFTSGASVSAFLLQAAETFVQGSAYGSQISFHTTANGSTSLQERMRIAHTGDLQMGGANTVISAARHPVLRAYAVAALPSAAPAGQLVYVSDGADNRRMAVSDGTVWRFPDGAVVA
jgi:hypothetical protein